jgi:heptosyltransferase-2
VLDLRGSRPLRELMSVLSHLHCLVSSSTGPMHVAAALRVPTVSLFCPIPACSPQLWGPRGNRAQIVLPPEGSCAARCPGDPKVCRFEEIEPETVVEAILESLSALAPR